MKCTRISVLNLFLLSASIHGASATNGKDSRHLRGISEERSGEPGGHVAKSRSVAERILEVVAVFPGNTPIEGENHSFQWSFNDNNNDGTSNLETESEGEENLAGGSHGNDNAAFGKGIASSGSFSISPAAKNANTGESVGSDVTEAEKSSLVAIASGKTASLNSNEGTQDFSPQNWLNAFKSESKWSSFGKMHSNKYKVGGGN
mmetsp:Transcript_41637/g.61097  ORF Transcript_41637/g.61097 Transcript_41637/m.61097 type:complete len:204 (-) Transcript_41637:227-838(-)|eukprot:CAMPEP_0195520976 /NCGR_PEP_ID=MMETSP0794_2-20130614/17715_1 /TAXON_ID=515487 /ORGANISM="Stephanopyxis turris, Strain CCMP 815" /LENGTH=203 /DNA_ID=CAMNT_0040650425 /DNA_START=104 /DNA_END=715 /DNA_ORIENTATION=+